MRSKLRSKIRQMLIEKHGVLLVLHNHKTGKKQYIFGDNIVTNEGDLWYAQSACGEEPDKAFANLFLCTAGPGTPGKADDYSDFTVDDDKAVSGSYPMTDDQDGDNSGAGVDIVTWLFEFTTGDGPYVDITHCFIAASGASGLDPILNSYKWGAAWSKDGDTSAKVFVNHEMLGA